MTNKVLLKTEEIAEEPFEIPGATPGGVARKVLNLASQQGQTALIIIMKPGSRIPAHFHRKGAETHYVIEGDFIEAGKTFGAGAFFTHAAGVVHGPHESKNGCAVLTIQEAYVDPNEPDFNIAE